MEDKNKKIERHEGEMEYIQASEPKSDTLIDPYVLGRGLLTFGYGLTTMGLAYEIAENTGLPAYVKYGITAINSILVGCMAAFNYISIRERQEKNAKKNGSA